MRFFMVDDTAETLQTAPLLRVKFGDDTTKVRPFFSRTKHCFKGMAIDDLVDTVWLGHSSESGIGEFSVSALVGKFSQEFNLQFTPEKKIQIQHLYIIGCEVALKSDHHLSVAQQIADALYAQGFTQVVIHAIANPVSPIVDAVMRVKVIRQAGLSGALSLQQAGDVHAYLMTRKQEERLISIESRVAELSQQVKIKSHYTSKQRTQILEELNKVIKEQWEMEKEVAFNTFLKTGNLKFELDREHNIFNPRQRSLSPRPGKNFEQEQALMVIEHQIRHLCDKNLADKRIIKLKALQKTVARETKEWRQHVQQVLKSFSWLDKHNQHSTTNHLLESLSNHGEKVSVVVTELRSDSPPIAELAKAFFGGAVSLGAKRKESKGEKALVPVAPPIMPETWKALEERVKQLDDAINARGCFALFYPKTKHYKRDVLQALVNDLHQSWNKQASVKACMALIRTAYADQKLIAGFFSQRTKHVLEKILTQESTINVSTPLQR